MAITDDLRKTLSDPTPFYFAAGTADLAFQQAKKVPTLMEQLRIEAPARIEAVRNTDPKVVQERATVRVRETQETLQARLGELLGSLDTDLKKLSESAQDLALRGVGFAAEYAVKARETYEKVAEHGEQAVKTWRGEAAENIEDIAVAVEPGSEPGPNSAAGSSGAAERKPQPAGPRADRPAANGAESAAVRKPSAAKKAPARGPKTTSAKKTTPPAK